jgi:phage gp46-like protein
VDVLLTNNADGGDIEVKNGVVTLVEYPLETAVLLSCFGGNDYDPGGDEGLADTWWGNVDQTDVLKHQRSETQFLLRSLPIIPANLRRIEDAAVRDCSWLVETKRAKYVRASASMPGINRVLLQIFVTVDETVRAFVFKSHDPAPLGQVEFYSGDSGVSGNQMLDGGSLMFDGGEPMTD